MLRVCNGLMCFFAVAPKRIDITKDSCKKMTALTPLAIFPQRLSRLLSFALTAHLSPPPRAKISEAWLIC